MRTITVDLADAAATRRLGCDLAMAARPGDRFFLVGELGAGKSELARAFIRTMADNPSLEVPSPTFTLVQHYDCRIPVIHADLYRLSGTDELEELGLSDNAGAILLVEWPERAAGLLGEGIGVTLEHAGDGRKANVSAPGAASDRIARSLAIRDFLAEAGLAGSTRGHFFGDASARSFEAIRPGAGEDVSILMNSPAMPDGPPIRDGLPYSRIAHLAESVTPFVAMATVLRNAGFAAPPLHAADHRQGLLLVGHLGTGGVLDAQGRPVAERYCAAAECLAAIHDRQWPEVIETAAGPYRIPPYDRRAMDIETELMIDWYLPRRLGRKADARMRAAWTDAWHKAFDRLAGCQASLVLRDFHSPNIIWRDGEKGAGRIGLIDFQDALLGPAAYDVASLGLDARVTIDAGLEQQVRDSYCAARKTQFDREAFERAYWIMGAQRNAKILGIFVRLDERDGKPAYLRHLPRIETYFRRAIAHPALAEVRSFVEMEAVLPDTT